MKIDYLKNNPREIQLEEDLPPYMTEGVANDIAEIFNTPLSGAYNWITLFKIIGSKNFMN